MDYEIKTIRDLTLGDGYLVKPCGENGGSGFRCCHGAAQLPWLNYKAKVFIGLGFNVKRQVYINKSTDHFIRTQTTQEFRRLYDRWYVEGDNGRMHKNFVSMLGEADFDEDSLAALYLDNGHSEIRKTAIRFSDKAKISIAPMFDNMSICVAYRDSNVLAEKVTALGYECKALRPFELRSRVTIYRVGSKQKLVDMLQGYCEKRGLKSTFAYKYDLPVRRHPERLSEGTMNESIHGCDSLLSTNNSKQEGGEGEPKSFPRLDWKPGLKVTECSSIASCLPELDR